MARPRICVPEARPGVGTVAVPESEAHHLRHVLRLQAGAQIAVFDGRGREWMARVSTVPKRGDLTVDLLAEMAPVPEPPVRVTLGIAILKGDQMDAVVRDATMLGVAAVAPFVSAHVVVPSRAWKGEAAHARWQRVAVASAKQCGRAVVPEIRSVAAFGALVHDRLADVRLMCAEPSAGAASTAFVLPARPASALVLIGPEGGWADEELETARSAGAIFLQCGPRTLRAETAPTVVLTALWTVWGW